MIYAMFMMVVLTTVVGLIAVSVRIASVKRGAVRARFFKLMQGQDVPEAITKTTRCLNNMFEVPTLFYVACTLYVALGVESNVGLVFAWLFVGLRCVQAYVHLTYNHVLHRMLSFFGGLSCVLVLWINLLVAQSAFPTF